MIFRFPIISLIPFLRTIVSHYSDDTVQSSHFLCQCQCLFVSVACLLGYIVGISRLLHFRHCFVCHAVLRRLWTKLTLFWKRDYEALQLYILGLAGNVQGCTNKNSANLSWYCSNSWTLGVYNLFSFYHVFWPCWFYLVRLCGSCCCSLMESSPSSSFCGVSYSELSSHSTSFSNPLRHRALVQFQPVVYRPSAAKHWLLFYNLLNIVTCQHEIDWNIAIRKVLTCLNKSIEFLSQWVQQRLCRILGWRFWWHFLCWHVDSLIHCLSVNVFLVCFLWDCCRLACLRDIPRRNSSSKRPNKDCKVCLFMTLIKCWRDSSIIVLHWSSQSKRLATQLYIIQIKYASWNIGNVFLL